jgi:hypothetical protein
MVLTPRLDNQLYICTSDGNIEQHALEEPFQISDFEQVELHHNVLMMVFPNYRMSIAICNLPHQF